MKYFLMPLGCQMNLADTKRIEKIIQSMGFEESKSDDDANLLGIIACSVRQKAVDRVYSQINKWNKRKDRERVLTFVSGCYLPEEEKKYLKLFDLVIKTEDTIYLPQLIAEYGVNFPIFASDPTEYNEDDLKNSDDKSRDLSVSAKISSSELEDEVARAIKEFNQDKDNLKIKLDHHFEGAKKSHKVSDESVFSSIKSIQSIAGSTILKDKKIKTKEEDESNIKSFWSLKPNYDKNLEGFIPIQNGCDKFCSFCAVPYTRGKEVSRDSEEIISEFKAMLGSGYKIITLLGQNVNSYGLDKEKEMNFNELLDKIGTIADESKKEVWIYFTSPHPRDFNDELIDIIVAHKSLAKQIHLPMQSGDDKLLFRMNRNHSMKRYSQIVDKIRSTIPDATIFTDIIVGFSKETLKQFENTKKAMEKFQFNMAYIALYSKRPGALSYRWPDDIDIEEKKRRHKELSDVLKKAAYSQNEKNIGRTQRVLIMKKNRKGFLEGINEGRINILIENTSDESLIGTFQDVKIESLKNLSMQGKALI